MRCLLAIPALALLASANLSWAQEPPDNGSGRLHFARILTTNYYRLPGSATLGTPPYLVTASAQRFGNPTAFKYQGSYRYTRSQDAGAAPAPSTETIQDWYLWDEATGQQAQITNFRGSLYVPRYGSRLRWSEDNLDSTLSFQVRDATVTPIVTHLVRTKLSLVPNAGVALTTPGFIPFDASDLDSSNPVARLEVVATWPNDSTTNYLITPDGSTVIYLEWIQLASNGGGTHLMRTHAIGSPNPVTQDPILYDARVTGIRPGDDFDITPNGTTLLFKGQTLYRDKRGNYSLGKPSGIVTLNRNTLQSSWLLTDTTTRTGRDYQGDPTPSPDGSAMFFVGRRISNGRAVAHAIWKLQFSTGAVTAVYEEPYGDVGLAEPPYLLSRWTD